MASAEILHIMSKCFVNFILIPTYMDSCCADTRMYVGHLVYVVIAVVWCNNTLPTAGNLNGKISYIAD